MNMDFYFSKSTDDISQPLVTVLVTTYNLEKFVVETLDSVKFQTYQNIELIVSDDGSTDDTINICKKWIEENKTRLVRSKIISIEKNLGIIAGTYNRGLFASEGEWIKPIAGDDALEADCIQDNINYVLNNQNVFVLFSYLNVYKNYFSKENFRFQYPTSPPINLITNINTAQQQYRLLLLGDKVGYVASEFFNMKALLNVGGWDERYEVQDNPMWLKLTKEGYKLHFMEKATVKYRQHENSHSHLHEKKLININNINMEQWRIDNVYPFLEWPYKWDFKYKHQLALTLKALFNNKKTKFSQFVYSVMLKWLNPFYYCISIIRVRDLILRKGTE